MDVDLALIATPEDTDMETVVVMDFSYSVHQSESEKLDFRVQRQLLAELRYWPTTGERIGARGKPS
jgi:hypothetical protein